VADSLPPPDVRQLSDKDLPVGEFPAGRRPDFRIAFQPDAHAQMLNHAAENLSVEVGGVLVGIWQQDEDGPFVVVTASIRAEAADSKFAEVTFTHESWAQINRQMDTRYSDRHIVGWYHSHPGFGIFLSERDEFIQQHFFSDPGQIAFVVDPVSKTEGVFVWRDGKPAMCQHYWVGDQIRLAGEERTAGDRASAQPREKPCGSSPASPPPAMQERASASSPNSGPDLLTFAQLARAALPYLALFVLGFLVANVRDAWERRTLVEGVAAHYGLWKGLRPGLRQCLIQLDADLRSLDEDLRALTSQPAEAASSDQKTAKRHQRLRDAQDRIRMSRELLRHMEQTYCLDVTETAIVAGLMAAKLAELQRMSQPRGAETTAPSDAHRDAGKESQRPTKSSRQGGQQAPDGDADSSAAASKPPAGATRKADKDP